MKGDFTRWTFERTKHYSAVLDQQGRVKTDADKLEEVEIASHLRRTALRDVVGQSGAPADNAGFELSSDSQGNLIIGAGHYYVDGILCVNEQDVSFTEQPDLPGQGLPIIQGRYLAYLDVWERHVTAIEDPDIREVALGGPDTTTRKKTICQVKLVQVDDDAHCLSPLPQWEDVTAPGDGQLSARAEPPEQDDNLCLVPPGAGFTGLENQLYRVEIHRGGGPGEATFTWDRDNASVALPIVEFLDGQPNRIRLGNAGKFGLHSLARDDLLEITDDIRELDGEPGLLRHVAPSEPITEIITLDEQVDDLSQDHHPKVRRRNSGEELTVLVDTFIPLEKGVEVRFEDGQYESGDYWLIPARPATGNVEWPIQNDEPIPQPPLGIEHHYCRLGLLDIGDGTIGIVADCRIIFPALAQNALKIERVEAAADNLVLPHNGLIRAENLPSGLNILFSAPLSEDVFGLSEREGQRINPAVEVQLALPEPLTPAEFEFWGVAQSFGFRWITLASSVAFTNEQRDRISWRPDEPARIWLRQLFSRLVPPGQTQPIVDRILCALRVRGDFIWADGPGDSRIFLDGETSAHPLRRDGLDFPSGNGQAGGDFYTWFWIVSDDVEVPRGGGGLGGPGDLSVIEINGIGPRFTEFLVADGVSLVSEFLLLSPRRIAEILPGVSEDRARVLLTNARLLLGQ